MYNARQLAILRQLANNGPSSARDLADAILPGSDTRGAAQTARRMPTLISRDDDGVYELTPRGQQVVRML